MLRIGVGFVNCKVLQDIATKVVDFIGESFTYVIVWKRVTGILIFVALAESKLELGTVAILELKHVHGVFQASCEFPRRGDEHLRRLACPSTDLRL